MGELARVSRPAETRRGESQGAKASDRKRDQLWNALRREAAAARSGLTPEAARGVAARRVCARSGLCGGGIVKEKQLGE